MIFTFQQGQFGRRKVSQSVTDPHFSDVRFLLHFEGAGGSTTFSDDSPIATRPTWTANNGASIDTAQFKFGNASGLFDGSNDNVSSSSGGVCRLGTGDLTLEAWVWLNSAVRGTIVSRVLAGGGGGGYMLDIDAAFKPRFALYTNGGTFNGCTGATTVTTGAWHHIAGTVSGTSMRVFLDGSVDGTATFSGTRGEPGTRTTYIGRDDPGTAGRFWNGWIDDLRGTAGVARYIAGFTPPSGPFPNS